MLTVNLGTAYLTAHGRAVIFFFLSPGLQSPVVRVVIPSPRIDTTSGPTCPLSSLNSQDPWQERNHKAACHINMSSLPTLRASQVEARLTNPFDHSPFPIRSWGIPMPPKRLERYLVIFLMWLILFFYATTSFPPPSYR